MRNRRFSSVDYSPIPSHPALTWSCRMPSRQSSEPFTPPTNFCGRKSSITTSLGNTPLVSGQIDEQNNYRYMLYSILLRFVCFQSTNLSNRLIADNFRIVSVVFWLLEFELVPTILRKQIQVFLSRFPWFWIKKIWCGSQEFVLDSMEQRHFTEACECLRHQEQSDKRGRHEQ